MKINSDNYRMGMLDRYKKKGGFFQLLQLLETSPTVKREQFLGLIATESPVWEDALRKRILTITRVYSWDAQFLVEVFSRLPPLTLASALHGNPSEQNEALLSCLPPISRRKIHDLMAESNPSPAEKSTCVAKILSEVRGFVSQGILKLDKVDPDLLVPENIEEILSVSGFISPTHDSEAQTKESKLSGNSDSESSSGSSGSNGTQHEIDFLRRKVNQLNSEINALKHENLVLKDKLSQIKRIA